MSASGKAEYGLTKCNGACEVGHAFNRAAVPESISVSFSCFASCFSIFVFLSLVSRFPFFDPYFAPHSPFSASPFGRLPLAALRSVCKSAPSLLSPPLFSGRASCEPGSRRKYILYISVLYFMEKIGEGCLLMAALSSDPIRKKLSSAIVYL